ncbi:MAG: SDR family NAD(P)-dependent oxidoreductase [Rhodospirillales bacterium]|nr:SDR family NAD(P)-dependent oxidoreductase [Rhodospirillales bacterium]
MDLGLSGRTALVTGASKGIGAAICRELAKEGCRLEMVARGEAGLAALAKELTKEFRVEARVHALDLAEPANQARLADVACKVDLLVNNAGAIPSAELDQVSEEQWMDGWRLKVFAYINMTRYAYSAMKARHSGVIVNVIGTGGERPDAKTIAASTGNAALIAFTRALGARSPDFGVRVIGVNPGGTETDRLVGLYRQRAKQSLGDPERWRELLTGLPFGRPAKPEEVGALVAFLASDRAGYLTGSIVNVDGGKAARPA